MSRFKEDAEKLMGYVRGYCAERAVIKRYDPDELNEEMSCKIAKAIKAERERTIKEILDDVEEAKKYYRNKKKGGDGYEEYTEGWEHGFDGAVQEIKSKLTE